MVWPTAAQDYIDKHPEAKSSRFLRSAATLAREGEAGAAGRSVSQNPFLRSTPHTFASASASTAAAELRAAAASHHALRRSASEGQRPAWDSTPLYKRPNALRGLKLYKTNDAWARDEVLYHERGGRASNYWSDYHGQFDVPGFSQLAPNRVFQWELRKIDYVGRWNNKFIETGTQIGGMRESGVGGYDRFDNNPFT